MQKKKYMQNNTQNTKKYQIFKIETEMDQKVKKRKCSKLVKNQKLKKKYIIKKKQKCKQVPIIKKIKNLKN